MSNSEQVEKAAAAAGAIPPKEASATAHSVLSHDGHPAEQDADDKPLGMLDRLLVSADKYWMWEIVGIVGSALLIGGLCGFLYPFDKKPVPNWAVSTAGVTVRGHAVPSVHIPVSINSIIGWFSTVGKILVMIPVVKGLGQLKWVWFSEQQRYLSDFETFESATRGVVGSAVLIWRMRAKHFAVLGALAMLIAIAYDPLIQDLVTYPLAWLPYGPDDYAMGGAVIARSSQFDAVDNYADVSIGNVDHITKSKILEAAIYDASSSSGTNFDGTSDFAIPYYGCGSSNCTYPLRPTISVIERCVNITDQLIVKCGSGNSSSCSVSLPNNFTLQGADVSTNHISAIDTTQNSGRDPIVFKNYSTTALAIIQSIGVDPFAFTDTTVINSSTVLLATECAIIPAVQVFNSSIGRTVSKSDLDTYGPISLEDTSIYAFDQAVQQPDGSITLNPPNNDTYQIGAGYNTNFRISGPAHTALRNFLSWIIPGHVEANSTVHRYVSDHGNDVVTQGMYSGVGTCGYLSPLIHANGHTFPAPTTDNIACKAQYMAMAITTAMRNFQYLIGAPAEQQAQDAAGQTSSTNNIDEGFVGGTTYREVSIVHVTWLWILMPVALWAISTAFTVGVIVRSRRAGVRTWRTNPLAAVFLDIGEAERQHVQQHELTEDGLAKRAKNLLVKLQVDDKEAKLIHRSRIQGAEE